MFWEHVHQVTQQGHHSYSQKRCGFPLVTVGPFLSCQLDLKLSFIIILDQCKLDEEIEQLRKNLKPKVNVLRDLEGKSELTGFNLQALSKEEMAAINQVLRP